VYGDIAYRNKSKSRAKANHVFAIVKRLRRFTKVLYRRLGEYANREFRRWPTLTGRAEA
jgi:hypothetical protein